jgi:hypothetical protein
MLWEGETLCGSGFLPLCGNGSPSHSCRSSLSVTLRVSGHSCKDMYSGDLAKNTTLGNDAFAPAARTHPLSLRAAGVTAAAAKVSPDYLERSAFSLSVKPAASQEEVEK